LAERVVEEVDTFERHRHGDDITVLAVHRELTAEYQAIETAELTERRA
jgi:hypothetical protein